jgi:hypothetical protein
MTNAFSLPVNLSVEHINYSLLLTPNPLVHQPINSLLIRHTCRAPKFSLEDLDVQGMNGSLGLQVFSMKENGLGPVMEDHRLDAQALSAIHLNHTLSSLSKSSQAL